MAKMFFRYGAMNSAKSMGLIAVAHNYMERDQKAIVLKPTVDTKSQYVLSRAGIQKEVDLHVDPFTSIRAYYDSLEAKPDCILVDEAQFLSPAQVEDLFEIVVEDDTPVIAYGLRTDFRTNLFPGSKRLLELAHNIEEIRTICRCGKKAILNGRIVNGQFVHEGDLVAIDGDVQYESLCGACFLEKVGSVHNDSH